MSTIKKLASLLLAMLMLAGCLPASAEDLAAQLVDTWIENDGWGTLILSADGTAVMNYYDDTVTECNWAMTEEGPKFLDGMWYNSPMELVGENTLSVSDGWMTFTREGAEVEEIPLDSVPVGEEGEPFLGTWSLSILNIDGSTFNAADLGLNMELTFYADGTVTSLEDGESNTSVWSVEYGAAMVDGLFLTLNDEGQLVLKEDDSEMIFVQGESAADSELSEDEQMLALLTMMMSQTNDETAALPEHLQGYVGEWHMVYTATGGLTGDLRTMGVTCTLDLYSDGDGSIDFPTYEFSTWYEEDGVVRFGESGMPMTLLEGGFLQYGTELGGYMIFSQDPEAVYTPATAEPTAVPEAEAPAAGRTFTSNEEYLGIKFVADTYTMAGQTYDAAVLGTEYSLLFYENGTCDFSMAGAMMPGLSWGLGNVAVGLNRIEAFSINYYGTTFNAVPTSTGFDMDFYGTMTLHFVPAE